jgi:phosphopantetheinyl transferase
MFHGPAFRGVLSLDRVGDDGAEAMLAADLHREHLRSDRGTFLTDPILLDQPGQVVGFWTAECLPRDYVIFPFYLEALHLYAAPFADDEYAQCRARIQLIGDQRVRSDLDIVGADGRVWAHFVGWEDRRFDLPDVFHRFLLSPQESTLGEAWPLALTTSAEQPPLQAVWLGVDRFPKDFFTVHGSIWQRVLANLILSRSEREHWLSLTQPEPRRIEWLLGRAAAKEAVRQHLTQQHDLKLCLADIDIAPDDKGRPIVQGAWLDRISPVPTVSISHSGGMAVAIAGSGVGLGVDIEHIGRMKAETEKVAFTPQERELLAALREAETEEWPLRLWCAKEAAAKAWGQGLYGGPLRFVARGIDQSTGIVQINVIDEGGQDVGGATLAAFTVRQGDLIAAMCCYRVESIEAGA